LSGIALDQDIQAADGAVTEIVEGRTGGGRGAAAVFKAAI